MKYQIHRQFAKDLKRLPHEAQKSIWQWIDRLELVDDVASLKAKSLRGHAGFYRVRVGPYRIGFSVESSQVILRRVLHRQRIYKKFP